MADSCLYCVEGQRRVTHSATGEIHTMSCFCTVKDLPVKVVIQPEPSGCGLAALATVAGLTYEDVRSLIHIDRDFTKEGTFESELQSLFDRLGFAWQFRTAFEARLGTKRAQWPCAPWAPIHLSFVKNLSNNAYHFVVMLKDGRVIDPWWGVVQGLHRYPEVLSIYGMYRVGVPSLKPGGAI